MERKQRSRSTIPLDTEAALQRMRWIDDDVSPGDGMSSLNLDDVQVETIYQMKNIGTVSNECLIPMALSTHNDSAQHWALPKKEDERGQESLEEISDEKLSIEKISEESVVKNADANVKKRLEDHNGTIRLRSLDARSEEERTTPVQIDYSQAPQLIRQSDYLNPTFATLINCLLLLFAIFGLFFLLIGIVIFAPINVIRRRFTRRNEPHRTFSAFESSHSGHVSVGSLPPTVTELSEDEIANANGNQPNQLGDDENESLVDESQSQTRTPTPLPMAGMESVI